MIFFLCLMNLWAQQPTLEMATQYWREGDVPSTISSLEQVVNQMPTLRSERGDSVRYLLGNAYFARGDYGLAARQFELIRVGNRLLDEIASFAEAQSNWSRGYHHGLKQNCDRIRTRWPQTTANSECLLMLGDSFQWIDYHNSSQQNYDQWLNQNINHPRYEAEYMRKLKGLMVKAKQEALSLMRTLYLNHTYPTTTRILKSYLGEADQKAVHVDEFVSLFWSIIRTGKLREGRNISHELESFFLWLNEEQAKEKEKQEKNEEEKQKQQKIVEKIQQDFTILSGMADWSKISLDVLQLWYEQNRILIYWKTRQYEKYAEGKIQQYEKTPDADLAWRIFQGYVKAAQWEKAVAWATDKQPLYEWRGQWVRGREEIALAHMYIKNYIGASKIWGRLRGRKADFMTGFCYYMNKDYAQARMIFERLQNKQDGFDVAGSYWTVQSYLEEKQYAKALEVANQILDDELALEWYQLLLQQQMSEGWFDADKKPISYVKDERYILHDPTLSKFTGHALVESNDETDNIIEQKFESSLKDWAFPIPKPSRKPVLSKEAKPDVVMVEPTILDGSISKMGKVFTQKYPDGYLNNLYLGDGKENYETLLKILPYRDLQKAQTLIEAGFHDTAAPLISPIYEQWKLRQSPNIEFSFWRSIMLYARNHHYAMRFTVNLEKEFTTVEERKQALRLNFPIVRAKQVFPHCQSLDLDPYLMYAIMRVESTYRDYVVSPAGAIGYIQVMPLTGAKLADILEREDYSPKDLENPQINLEYGTHYFSMLMRRFGYAFPLAAASYNGGPHNVSRWLKNLKDIRLDQFVEHIAFDESRIYAKKVSTHYANYVALYEGHPIQIPWYVPMDDPTVVDF